MAKLSRDWVGESVSHGTMREEDLIPAFEAFLEAQGIDLSTLDRPTEAIERLFDGEMTDADWESVSWYLNEELFEAMNDIAPDGCYFGSHPGDGCDYGFWQDECDEDE